MKKVGFVTLAGAGPGDEMLITRKAFQALEHCEVLVYDSLSSDVFLRYVPEGCEKIYVGKRCGHHSMKQEEINALLVEKAEDGKRVVRLKGGDPFVFGRGGEEVLALEQDKIPYEVIPGVTSAVAAPALAGIPVTHRGMSRSFHVITGHTATIGQTLTDNFDVLAKLEGTLVFLMGLNNLSGIVDGLLSHGKSSDTPVAIIENGTLPNQRRVTGTLATIEELATDKEIISPAIIVVGEVASLDFCCKEERIKNTRPLSGTTVGVTGTKRMAEKLAGRLEEEGAKVLLYPYSKVEAYPDLLDSAFQNIENYQWVVFTSSNSIRIFFRRMKDLKIDYRKLARMKFAVIGTGTGDELEKHGFYPDYIPKEYTVKELGTGLLKIVGKEDKLLIPRAKKGSEELTRLLDKKDIAYDEIKIYDIVVKEEVVEQMAEELEQCDYVTFESSSGVAGFFTQDKAAELLEKVMPVCIGEVTADTLKKHGVHKMLIGTDNTVEGIVASIKEKKA